jgi:hypothetical protein
VIEVFLEKETNAHGKLPPVRSKPPLRLHNSFQALPADFAPCPAFQKTRPPFKVHPFRPG